MQKCKNEKIYFANALRGFAALSVVIYHYFGLFWTKREAVEALTNAPHMPLISNQEPFYVLWLQSIPQFNLGAYGVAIFFLVSGFVIPISLEKLDVKTFLIRRIFRILPVYIVGFSVTLLFLAISSVYYGRDWPYSILEVLIHYLPGLRDLMWSRGIDGIVWTLEIEVKFYVLCAVMAGMFRKKSTSIFYWPLLIFLLGLWVSRAIPTWLHTNGLEYRLGMAYVFFSQYIIYMFVGVVFNYIFFERLDKRWAYGLIIYLFIIFNIHCWMGPYAENVGLGWSYGLAILTFSLIYERPQLFGEGRIMLFFSRISYPLYVIHGVAGYVVLQILVGNHVNTWVSLFLVFSGSIICSWFVHVFVEEPFMRIGRKILFNAALKVPS